MLTSFICYQVHHGEELEQLKRDMAIVLQASLGAAPSPSKGDDSNVQQLKNRIHQLEQEAEELSKKYNEELKTERVNNCVCNLVESWGKTLEEYITCRKF